MTAGIAPVAVHHPTCNVLSNCAQPKIEEYAVIGDCRAAALVSNHGSLDWLCWPKFDSPSIFAALLDPQKGGFWKIAPATPFRTRRAYIENTNVLQTHFTCSDGEATLTDLMPVMNEEDKRKALIPNHELVRQLGCKDGSIEVKVDFHPRADYGAKPLRIGDLRKLGMRIDAGSGSFWLRTNCPMVIDRGRAHAVVNMKRGDVLHFSLTYAEEASLLLMPKRRLRFYLCSGSISATGSSAQWNGGMRGLADVPIADRTKRA